MVPKPTYEVLEERIIDLEKQITDYRPAQAEKALRESEAQKAAILNGITTNLAFVNENLEILWTNKAAADSVGKTMSQLVGHKCHEIWADPENPCENCPTVKAFKTRKTENLIIRTPDGRVWDEKGEPVFGEKGELLGVLEIAHDITEKTRSEEALQKTEEGYRELFDSITDLIYTQDLEGRFLSVNPALETLFGYRKEEIVGRKASDLMEPKWRPFFETDYLETLKKKGIHEGISVYYHKNGQKLFLEYRSKLVHTKDGEPYISGVGRDVTPRIEAEKDKKQLQEQLLQSRKMEAIGTLTGGIAHDYNNLLAIVMGNVSLAMDETESGSDLADFLEEITRSGHKLRDLTHELMALAKGGAPMRELGSLKELIQGVSGAIPDESGISLEKFISRELWPVSYDRHKMWVVLRNIVTNAVEAMSQGGTITVSAENLSLDEDAAGTVRHVLKRGDYVHIAIQDQGTGIPEEHLDKIFDPYFSTKAMGAQKGMGLGLATSFAIVQKHGGHIAVASIPDKGTTVHLYLPAESQAQEQKIKTFEDENSSFMKRILLMDDEEMLLKLGEQMLKKLGYAMEAVTDGAQAIKIYKKQMDLGEPFDAVILDLTIKGGMGGEQTIRELLKIDPNVKGIVSSGYFNDPVMSDFEKYGFMGAMAKPYEMRNLAEVLENVFSCRARIDQ